jgi:hypothetical protein
MSMVASSGPNPATYSRRITRNTDLRIAQAPDLEQVRCVLARYGGPWIVPPGGPAFYTKDLRPDLFR